MKKTRERFTRIKLTDACVKAHPFIVVRNGQTIGRFASLYCAAQTALHNENHGAEVFDERAGRQYGWAQLMCAKPETTVMFQGRQAVQMVTHMEAVLNG